MSSRDEYGPTLLTFHKVSRGLSFGATNYSPRRLRSLLSMLQRRGYSFGQSAESVVATFDDGYAHLREVLPPLMEEFGLAPIIFVPTHWIGRSNTWDYSALFRRERHLSGGEVRELAGLGVRFGSHGHTHRDLRRLTEKERRAELEESKRRLEDILGEAVTSLSYPFGGCDGRVAAAAAEAGYHDGYTMRFPAPGDGPLSRGRLGIYTFDTHGSILQKLERGPLYEVERLIAAATNRLSAGTRWYRAVRGVFTEE